MRRILGTRTIRYKGGYKYQVQKDCRFDTKIICTTHIKIHGKSSLIRNQKVTWVSLTPQGRLNIRGGYAWDGASGPVFDTKHDMRGSLAHDALYQLIREKKLKLKYRKKADQLLRDMCLDDGIFWLWAWIIYFGVRIFGRWYAKPGHTHDNDGVAP